MRLIDAGKLMEHLEKVIKDNPSFVDVAHIMGMQEVVKEQPTAYDVDKVVSQLRKDKFIDCETVLSDVHQGYNAGLSRAIEIVKADIDIENNHDKEVYLTALEDYHRLISEECKFMLIKCNPYALHLKEYNDKVLEQLKAGGNS